MNSINKEILDTLSQLILLSDNIQHLHWKVEELIQLNDQLSQLHWFTTQIVSEVDLDSISRLVLNAYSQLTGMDKCSLFLFERGVGLNEVCSINKDFDLDPNTCEAFKSISNKASYSGKIEIKDIVAEGYCGSSCDKVCKYKAIKVFTMYQRDGYLLGYLVGYGNDHIELSEDQSKFLDIFVMQIGLTIESALLRSKFETLAFVDELTQLSNKRSFNDRLEQEVERCKRKTEKGEDSGFCVIMMDVDSFKHYNDTFGHPAGDVVLKQIGSLILKCIRKVDVGARYGGEEMAVILPDTSLDNGVKVAESIRKSIEENRFLNRDVTISVGVAHYPYSLKSEQDSIVDIADRCLYHSKKNGKNMVSTPEVLV